VRKRRIGKRDQFHEEAPIGALRPTLALEALTGERISVEAPFFHARFVPLFIPLLVAMSFGLLLAWKRGDLYGVARLVGSRAAGR
jgi:cytochrome c-type biogenesis protein CcmF